MPSRRDQIRGTNPLTNNGKRKSTGLGGLAEVASIMSGGAPLDKAHKPEPVETPHGLARIEIIDARTFQFGRIELNATGLSAPQDLTEDEWFDVGYALLGVQSAIQWWLGDWLKEGEDRKWRDSYEELAERFSYEIDTVYHFASVARKVHQSIRRADLSFSHHRLVTKLDAEAQEYWLDLASEKEWTVAQFRDELKRGRGEHGTPSTLDTVQLNVERFQRTLLTKVQQLEHHQRRQIADYLRALAEQVERE